MLIYILIAAAVIVIGFVIVVATRPSEFRVTRSTTISAPPSSVFEQVNDFHRWNDWSPWARMDPNARNSYDGAAAGVDAGFAWSGNSKVGEGRMTITESVPPQRIGIRLEFIRPFKATNLAEFTFRPQGDQTHITWSMSGRANFFFKAMGLLMNCDDMIGKDFDRGLAQMKSIVESARAPEYASN